MSGRDDLARLSPLSLEEEESEDGYQGVAVVRSDLVVVRIHGHIRAGRGTDRVSESLKQAVGRALGVRVFFNLEGFQRYDTEVRVRYTRAIQEHSRNVTRVWIHADSKLVRMGASVAGLVLPQLELIDRTLFFKYLDEMTHS